MGSVDGEHVPVDVAVAHEEQGVAPHRSELDHQRPHRSSASNPRYDIVRLLRLDDEGKLELDEVNQGHQDLRDGKNIRGVIDDDS